MTYTHFTHPNPNKDIFLIDMRDEQQYPFSELVEKGLTKYIKQNKKILIIASKKGYASGTLCKDCGFIPRCRNCDVAIAVHKQANGDSFGMCHICKTQYTVSASCQHCSGHNITNYGVGTQQVAESIDTMYKTSTCIVDGTVANSPRKIAKIYQDISETQVVIATSLLTTPPVDIQFDLVIVMTADTSLHIPDMSSNWYCFLFLIELFRKHTTPTFLIQTYNPEHYAIKHACALDEKSMRTQELARRKINTYPPYTQICTLLYKHEIEERLYGSTNKLYQELLFLKEQYDMTDLEIYTTPPLVYKVWGKYRYHIILKGTNLRQFMDITYSKLKMRSRGFKIDWEPTKIL